MNVFFSSVWCAVLANFLIVSICQCVIRENGREVGETKGWVMSFGIGWKDEEELSLEKCKAVFWKKISRSYCEFRNEVLNRKFFCNQLFRLPE